MEDGIGADDCVGGGEAALGSCTEGRLGSPSSVAFLLVSTLFHSPCTVWNLILYRLYVTSQLLMSTKIGLSVGLWFRIFLRALMGKFYCRKF